MNDDSRRLERLETIIFSLTRQSANVNYFVSKQGHRLALWKSGAFDLKKTGGVLVLQVTVEQIIPAWTKASEDPET